MPRGGSAWACIEMTEPSEPICVPVTALVVIYGTDA
jgi:hypothetical protein